MGKGREFSVEPPGKFTPICLWASQGLSEIRFLSTIVVKPCGAGVGLFYRFCLANQSDPRRPSLGKAESPGRAAGAVPPVQRRAPGQAGRARLARRSHFGKASFANPVGVSLAQGPNPGLERPGKETRTLLTVGIHVLRGGDHPSAATPRIAMETAAAADQSFSAAQPRVPRQGHTDHRSSYRERDSAPRNKRSWPRLSVSRSAAWELLCRQEPVWCLFHHGAQRR